MPEFVSIDAFRKLTNCRLSKLVIRELCAKGVIPHIKTQKGHPRINLQDAPQAIREYSVTEAAKTMQKSGASTKVKKSGGKWSLS